MSVELIRGLYDYHRWANRRLFEVAKALGDATTRDMGEHWSVPTLNAMFVHLYGADAIWLTRWTAVSPDRMLHDADVLTLDALRPAWDLLESQQRAFVEGLSERDLAHLVAYRNAERVTLRVPLGPLLHHVVNHGTHHRSEAATMITLISGSPPGTGIATYRTTVARS